MEKSENNIVMANNLVNSLSGLIKIINIANTTIKNTEPQFRKFLKDCEIEVINDKNINDKTGESLKEYLNEKNKNRYDKREKYKNDIEFLKNKLKKESDLDMDEIEYISDRIKTLEKKINSNKIKESITNTIINIAQSYNYDIKFNPEILGNELEKFKQEHLSKITNTFNNLTIEN